MNFFLPEPDSYPNRETSISTRNALLRRNVVEQKIWKREESMKNADLIIFFCYNFVLLPKKKFQEKILVLY